MKVAKLVAGILCEILAVVILFQSCAAGIVDALEETGGTSGGAGMIVAFLMIAGPVRILILLETASALVLCCFVMWKYCCFLFAKAKIGD